MSIPTLSAAQVHWAHLMQAARYANQQWSAQQSAAGIDALHAQLDALMPAPAIELLHKLTDLQQNFFSSCSQQQKAALALMGARTQACIDDLRRAQTGDDVGMVVSGYASDVGTQLRAQLEQMMGLMNSAGAASEVLTQKLLDQMTGAAPQA